MIRHSSSRKPPLALIVNADLPSRLSMTAALAKVDFKVNEAVNGEEAIILFQSDNPDIILIDAHIPEMDGFEICAAIRALPSGKYVQILMITETDDTNAVERAFKAGANDFIAKPLNGVMLGYRGLYLLRAAQTFYTLNSRERRLVKTQKRAQLAYWEFDLTNNIFHCSPEASSLLGLTDNRQLLSYEDFLAPVINQEYMRVKEEINAAIQEKTLFGISYQISLPDKTLRHILNRGEILFDETGNAEIIVGSIQDVTDLKYTEEEIRQRAFYDGLTGLANRMLFMDRLDHELSLAKRKKQHFALLFLDLDQFKRINDTFGHHVGDLLLKNVSEILQRCIRHTDMASRPVSNSSDALLARLGGDEFIILLPDINEPDNAAIVARRILHEITAPQPLEGHEISATTSIGISVFPVDGEKAEVLLKHADSAMYHAKGTGRNNYQFFKESLNVEILERIDLEQNLKRALERDEFLLYYQPQIQLSTRKIIGAEALIRWVHPLKGTISPNTFIPIAKESGLISDINNWVIQTACWHNNKWTQGGFGPIKISVNLSGHQLANQNIIQIIRDALQENDLEAKYLEVEVTESMLTQDNEATVWILQQMKDLGITIALDDFGTGCSSLSDLTTFPLDSIKIDHSFVTKCAKIKSNLLVIKAIIAMGHCMGIKIVAEGIETKEQLNLLKEFGADEGQGYYFSPPVSQDDFVKLLTKGSL